MSYGSWAVGFYVSWQSASQQLAVVFAGVLGFGLSQFMAPENLDHWGWRIPLIVGCLIVPFIYMSRRSLQETEEFSARRHHPPSREIYASLLQHWLALEPSFVKLLTVELWLSFLYASYNGAMPGAWISLAAAIALATV